MKRTRQAETGVSIPRTGSKAVREQLTAYLFLAPVLILLLFTKYIPIVMGMFVSFFEIKAPKCSQEQVYPDSIINAEIGTESIFIRFSIS